MKLDYKKTIFVGFAFFLICAFWQAYDTIVPLMLVNKFGLNQTWSGVIMALDNVFAVVLLPIFGAISDKSTSKYGKRTPYIVIGTVLAIITFMLMTFADAQQLKNIEEIVSGVAVEEVKLPLTAVAEFTRANPLPLILFIVALLLTLLAMSVFRSPAVALMPDVTVKPLRSKANAIINLMGAAGGIIVLGLGIVFKTGKRPFMNYIFYNGAVCLVMLLGLIMFICFVKENKWAKQMEEESKLIESKEEEQEEGNSKLQKDKLVSLIFILSSVALWYAGYNAVTSKFSVYATNVLSGDYAMALIVAQAFAIITYIPVGIIASKIGRKKCILAGVLILALAFFIAIFIKAGTSGLVMNIVFALAGIGWATINVNSFPMVVELAKGNNIGKYTGYYYTASMFAQVLTPVLSGVFMDAWGMQYTLFIYATAFVMLSFVTMLFVKHGDNKPESKKSLIEHLDVDAD